MGKFTFIFILTAITTACSFDVSLIKEASSNGPTPSATELAFSQVQKAAFDFYFKLNIDFGAHIAAAPNANFVFVAAPNADSTFPYNQSTSLNLGAVVYKKTATGYIPHQVLRHPLSSQRYFGSSVAASNDWLAVGTMMDNKLENNSTNDAQNSGSISLFKWDSGTSQWVYAQKLKAPTRYTSMSYGQNVVFNGDHLAVYAERANGSTYNSGAVYLYKFDGSTWQYLHTLAAAVPTSYRNFGAKPVFFNNQLYLTESGSSISGKVNIYNFNGSNQWIFDQSITSTQSAGDYCASNIAVTTDLIVLTCPYASINGKLNVGKLNILKNEAGLWVDKGVVVDSAEIDGALLGERISLSNDNLFVSNTSSPGRRVHHYKVESNRTLTYKNSISSNSDTSDTFFGADIVAVGDQLFSSQMLAYRFSDIPGAVLNFAVAGDDVNFVEALGYPAPSTRSVSANAALGGSLAVADNGTVLIGATGNRYQPNFPTGYKPSQTNMGAVSFYKTNLDKTVTILGARTNNDNNRRDDGMFFGHSISTSGNLYVIGAPGAKKWVDDLTALARVGLISVNIADFLSEIPGSFGNPVDVQPADEANAVDSRFGEAVKLDGNYVFAGAPEHQLSSASKYGKVYTYALNLATAQADVGATIDAGTFKTPNMRFGASLDYASGVLVVGAPGASQTPDAAHTASDAGGVWVYNYNGTTATLQNVLMGNQIFKADGSIHSTGTTTTWQAGDGFGTTVLTLGNQIIVGSPGANSGAGAIFVYKYNSVSSNYDFMERLDMTAYSGQASTADAGFGYALTMINNHLAVGAPKENTDEDNSAPLANAGAVYVFEISPSGFKCKKKLTPRDRTAESFFGQSLTYQNSSLYVGSPGHSLDENDGDDVPGAGAFFVFEVSGN